jgi:hypothetical protein
VGEGDCVDVWVVKGSVWVCGLRAECGWVWGSVYSDAGISCFEPLQLPLMRHMYPKGQLAHYCPRLPPTSFPRSLSLVTHQGG